MEEEIAVLAKIPVSIPFTNISFNIVITEVIVTSWIIMALLILWAYLATRKMKAIPTGLQNSAEIVVETVNNFVKNLMGEHHYRAYAPYIGTLGLYLLFSNTLGALFFTKPPTRTFAIPVALAIMTIILVIASSIRYRGLKGWAKSFFEPIPIMFPFNLLEYIIKPLSLCMRLFGNILGAYILMEMLIHIPVAPSFASLYFDLFDGGLQAFVFVLLTTLYVSEAIGEEE